MHIEVTKHSMNADPKVQQHFKDQLPAPYSSEIWSGQNFIGQGHYGKVKSRSNHDAGHIHPLTNVPTKYRLPTPYGFRDKAQTRFYRSRSLRQRSNQGQSIMLHTYTPLTNVPTKYQLPRHYGFRDIAQTRFYRSRSLQQGQIKVRPRRCTPTPPNQCPY